MDIVVDQERYELLLISALVADGDERTLALA